MLLKTKAALTALATGPLLLGAVVVADDPAGAGAVVSQSRGQFLSGVIGGTSLDQVAGIDPVTAVNSGGDSVTHRDTLSVHALMNAVNLPLSGVGQLPGHDAVHLGAVSQFAQANPDGSAHGASGAISNSGGIAVGGSAAAPADASLDLSGMSEASPLSRLGNVRLGLGALSAKADQASGAAGAQTGTYQIAGLTLDLSSPALAGVTGPLVDKLSSSLASMAGQLNSAGLGVVTVTGIDRFPSAADALTSLSLGGGAITGDLKTGTVHIDLAALLKAAGLDLNGLPPNTSLMPYLSRALSASIPTAVSSMLSTLQHRYADAFANLGFSIAGTPIDAGQLKLLTPTLDQVSGSLTKALTDASAQFANTVFLPLASAFAANLDIIVNGQASSGGTFTESAVQLKLGSGATSAQLVLASASVGPSSVLTDAPAPASTPSAVSNPPVGRSRIKIDAGGGSSGSRPGWLLGAGAGFTVVALAAALMPARRRPLSERPLSERRLSERRHD
ncbi:choice-of-anchor G family protein [Jatrophihabitans telluris]|uniref:Choice-of-anchor G family protein n=1 Tax=Jatrophihabitans telluris TaxID=2038343 RepID=A0ABY4QZE3_9ACTN|nr:choice-of-anchor G family protein [Jatrophihabitans telluris]UQX88216.1 choice-of-anchor G family protein [Jatrophihabitans telluris]